MQHRVLSLEVPHSPNVYYGMPSPGKPVDREECLNLGIPKEG